MSSLEERLTTTMTVVSGAQLETVMWHYWDRPISGSTSSQMGLVLRMCVQQHGSAFQVITPAHAERALTAFWTQEYLKLQPHQTRIHAQDYARLLWLRLETLSSLHRHNVVKYTWLHLYGGIWVDDERACLRNFRSTMLEPIGAGSGDNRLERVHDAVHKGMATHDLPKVVALKNHSVVACRSGALYLCAKEIEDRLRHLACVDVDAVNLGNWCSVGRANEEVGNDEFFGWRVLQMHLPPSTSIVLVPD
ncbi:MAG: hypothetical protein MHM6MM_004589 [Cercozoa sp. M6MM]